MNLFSLAKKFPTEEMALAYWIKARWPNGVRCVACDHDKVYLIETKGKTGRPYRKFECADCGLHFSPTANTIFHDSHLPLQKWFMAISLMTEAKKGISASQLGRHLGISYKTAWHLCHRIREAMQEPKTLKLGGESVTVEVDETYVGGRKRGQGVKAGKRSKTIVVGIAERDGSIHLQTVKSSKTAHVRSVIDSKLDEKTDKVVTDGDGKFKTIFPKGQHVIGVHKKELWTKNWTSTQTVENAFSLCTLGSAGAMMTDASDANTATQFLVSSVIQTIEDMAMRIEAYREVIRQNEPDLETRVNEAEARLRTSLPPRTDTDLRHQAIQAAADDNLGALAGALGEVIGTARIRAWGTQ